MSSGLVSVYLPLTKSAPSVDDPRPSIVNEDVESLRSEDLQGIRALEQASSVVKAAASFDTKRWAAQENSEVADYPLNQDDSVQVCSVLADASSKIEGNGLEPAYPQATLPDGIKMADESLMRRDLAIQSNDRAWDAASAIRNGLSRLLGDRDCVFQSSSMNSAQDYEMTDNDSLIANINRMEQIAVANKDRLRAAIDAFKEDLDIDEEGT